MANIQKLHLAGDYDLVESSYDNKYHVLMAKKSIYCSIHKLRCRWMKPKLSDFYFCPKIFIFYLELIDRFDGFAIKYSATWKTAKSLTSNTRLQICMINFHCKPFVIRNFSGLLLSILVTFSERYSYKKTAFEMHISRQLALSFFQTILRSSEISCIQSTRKKT